MYSKTQNRLKLQLFPSQLINKKSKWYQLETLVPWSEIEEDFSGLFSNRGRNAISIRHIIGVRYISEE